MSKSLLMNFEVDKENRLVLVDREFAAPVALVWDAWTKSEMLDQWWAPKPYRTETKSMNFSNGGRWHYRMIGPEGDAHWCLAEYDNIRQQQFFNALDAFCDEDGNINMEFPRSQWSNAFHDRENGEMTLVKIEIRFEKMEDLEKTIEMGFREGFTMGLQNLDEYLATFTR